MHDKHRKFQLNHCPTAESDYDEDEDLVESKPKEKNKRCKAPKLISIGDNPVLYERKITRKRTSKSALPDIVIPGNLMQNDKMHPIRCCHLVINVEFTAPNKQDSSKIAVSAFEVIVGVIGEDLTCDLLAGEYDLQMTRRFKGYRTRTKKGMSDIAPSKGHNTIFGDKFISIDAKWQNKDPEPLLNRLSILEKYQINDDNQDVNAVFNMAYRIVCSLPRHNCYTHVTNGACPICYLRLKSASATLGHLKTCHPRFSFHETPQEYRHTYNTTDYRHIDISLSGTYDGSYEGAPHLAHTHGLAYHEPLRYWLDSDDEELANTDRLPTLRNTHTEIITYRQNQTMADCLRQLLTTEEMPITNRYRTGHRRIYYSAITCQPIKVAELEKVCEMDDNCNWQDERINRMIDDYTDINNCEKEMMKVWNKHVNKHKYLGMKSAPRACIDFIKEHGHFIKSRRLERNLILHFCNMFDFNLVSDECIVNAMLLYHNMYKRRRRQQRPWKHTFTGNNGWADYVSQSDYAKTATSGGAGGPASKPPTKRVRKAPPRVGERRSLRTCVQLKSTVDGTPSTQPDAVEGSLSAVENKPVKSATVVPDESKPRGKSERKSVRKEKHATVSSEKAKHSKIMNRTSKLTSVVKENSKQTAAGKEKSKNNLIRNEELELNSVSKKKSIHSNLCNDKPKNTSVSKKNVNLTSVSKKNVNLTSVSKKKVNLTSVGKKKVKHANKSKKNSKYSKKSSQRSFCNGDYKKGSSKVLSVITNQKIIESLSNGQYERDTILIAKLIVAEVFGFQMTDDESVKEEATASALSTTICETPPVPFKTAETTFQAPSARSHAVPPAPTPSALPSASPAPNPEVVAPATTSPRTPARPAPARPAPASPAPTRSASRRECSTSYAARSKYYTAVFRHRFDSVEAYSSDFGEYVSDCRSDLNGYSTYYSDGADMTSDSDGDDGCEGDVVCDVGLGSGVGNPVPEDLVDNEEVRKDEDEEVVEDASAKSELAFLNDPLKLRELLQTDEVAEMNWDEDDGAEMDSETEKLVKEFHDYCETNPPIPPVFCKCEKPSGPPGNPAILLKTATMNNDRVSSKRKRLN